LSHTVCSLSESLSLYGVSVKIKIDSRRGRGGGSAQKQNIINFV